VVDESVRGAASPGRIHFKHFCRSLAVSPHCSYEAEPASCLLDTHDDNGLSRIFITASPTEDDTLGILRHIRHFLYVGRRFTLVAPAPLITEPLSELFASCGLRSGAMFNWHSMVRFNAVPLPAVEPLEPSRVSRVETEEDIRGWSSVVAESFATPSTRDGLAAYLQTYAHTLPRSTDLFLLRAEGHVVATAAIFTDIETGSEGIYWVATMPAARRQGHAKTLLSHLLRRRQSRDGRFLQSTRNALPLYRSCGFEPIESYALYLPAYF
jgi:ribosomal protein S18 acetylase RimI-like enzyme